MNVLKSAAAASAMLGLVACHTTADPAPPDGAARVEASIATVEQVDWPSTFEAGGVLRSALSASVSSRIVAPVVAVHVSAGDPIRRGRALVTLDARDLRARADAAAAALVAARESTRAEEANQAEADAALTHVRATYDRIRTLHETRSATPQELDDAAAAVSGAAARLSAARARAAAAIAAHDAATAAAEAAQVGLSYSVLEAPFDGIVARRFVDPGALAMPGMELLAVESGVGYRLEVQVDESRRSGLAPGDTAQVRLDSAGEPAAWTAAHIAEIARIDSQQHSFLVKLDMAGVAGAHSGAFGRVRFFGPARRALAAPASAVVRRGQLWYAFALDRDDVARLRVLSPGERRGAVLEIQSGLDAGDRLVVDPPATLQDGAPVRVATTAAARQRATEASR